MFANMLTGFHVYDFQEKVIEMFRKHFFHGHQKKQIFCFDYLETNKKQSEKQKALENFQCHKNFFLCFSKYVLSLGKRTYWLGKSAQMDDNFVKIF